MRGFWTGDVLRKQMIRPVPETMAADRGWGETLGKNYTFTEYKRGERERMEIERNEERHRAREERP